MLIRQNFYHEKKDKIESYVLGMVDDIKEIMNSCMEYLDHPTSENKQMTLDIESHIDQQQKKIDEAILDLISVQHLNVPDIKWLFTINRMTREFERIGDQIINVITFCDTCEVENMKAIVEKFYRLELEMISQLKTEIKLKQSQLEHIINMDLQVNELNRYNYDWFTQQMNKKQVDAKWGSKAIIVSRFLERAGDHIVNAGKLFSKYLSFYDEGIT